MSVVFSYALSVAKSCYIAGMPNRVSHMRHWFACKKRIIEVIRTDTVEVTTSACDSP